MMEIINKHFYVVIQCHLKVMPWSNQENQFVSDLFVNMNNYFYFIVLMDQGRLCEGNT